MPKAASGHSAIRPLLERIGLDEKEIEVYLALLSMKMARVSVIAKAAKQSRSHTYLVLRSLAEKGLVSEVERGKILHFVAEQPERLLGYLTDREQEIEALKPLVEGAMPLLHSLTAPLVGAPRVTTASGMYAMKQLYRDVLRHDFCAFFDPQSMYKMFDANVMMTLLGKNAPLHGRDLVTWNAGGKKYKKEMDVYKEHQVRFLPKEIDFRTDMIIFGDSIALFAYDADQTIVRIENQSLAASLQALFEGMWLASSK